VTKLRHAHRRPGPSVIGQAPVPRVIAWGDRAHARKLPRRGGLDINLQTEPAPDHRWRGLPTYRSLRLSIDLANRARPRPARMSVCRSLTATRPFWRISPASTRSAVTVGLSAHRSCRGQARQGGEGIAPPNADIRRVWVVVELAGARSACGRCRSEREFRPPARPRYRLEVEIMMRAVGLIGWWEQVRHHSSSVFGSSS
jgi:hypothetical protein